MLAKVIDDLQLGQLWSWYQCQFQAVPRYFHKGDLNGYGMFNEKKLRPFSGRKKTGPGCKIP